MLLSPAAEPLSHSYATPPLSTKEQFAIDVEIEQESDEERVCILRRRRNKLSPIAKLPSEILIHAFLLFVSRKEERLSWWCNDHMLITHVCHRWRQEALNFPLLWSNIPLDKLPLPWAHEYVKRSQQSLLDISGEFGTSSLYMNTVGTMEAKLTFLRTLIESSGLRIRDLALRAYGLELSGIYSLVSAAAVHAPNIESISIRYKAELGLRASTKESVELSSIFQGGLSQLRNLTILGFPIRWPDGAGPHALSPSQLTTLYLNNVTLISTASLLTLLSLTPDLQNLNLGELPTFAAAKDTEDDDDSIPANHVVPLEKLVRFVFQGSLARCLSLLSHIRYPFSDTRINATIWSDPSSPTLRFDVKRLFEYCGTITTSLPCGFEVEVESQSSASLRFYDRIRRFEVPEFGPCSLACAQRTEPIAAVTVCSREPSQDLLETVLPALPLSGVKQVGLAGSIDSDAMRLIMSRTPHATMMKLSSYNILPACTVLCERGENGFLYLPRLTDAWICHADFEYFPELGRLGCTLLVNQFLNARSSGGARIKHLDLSDNVRLCERMVKVILERGGVDVLVWGDLLSQEVKVLRWAGPLGSSSRTFSDS